MHHCVAGLIEPSKLSTDREQEVLIEFLKEYLSLNISKIFQLNERQSHDTER